MCRGLRHGYGVRKSAPYGDSQLNNPHKNGQQQLIGASMLIHSNSLQSAGNSIDLDDDSPKLEDGFKPNIDRTLGSKNGFVLVAKPLDVPMQNHNHSPSPSPSSYNSGNKHFLQNNNSSDKKGGRTTTNNSRRNSLTGKLVNAASRIPGTQQTASSIFKGLRLRKQKSTSDLDQQLTNSLFNNQTSNRAGVSSRAAGGFAIATSPNSGDGTPGGDNSNNIGIPFTLSPEELDITDPTTVETYTGEWKHDKRNGHGVCERSDGLKYEGQWHNDMKCGYGCTTFKDGTKEEGKYKNNILIADSKVKRFFQFGGANMRQRIDDSIKMAQQAQTMALKKAEIADTRAATARDKADQATTAALEADRDSQIAFSVARQYSNDSSQQQLAMSIGLPQQQQHQHQQQQQQHMMMMSSMMQQQQQLPNLGMPQSSLQMRRISSQNQQRLFPTADGSFIQDNNNQMISGVDQQQQQQLGRQQSYLMGPAQQQSNLVEPFNGRRGSFRGGSGSQPSSGYQSAFASRNNHPTINFNSPMSNVGGANVPGARLPNTTRQSSTDPFNDLFDHYKSSATSSSGYGPNQQHRRMMPGKQASLDYPTSSSSGINLRASVPRQFNPTSDMINNNDDNSSSSQRLRRFRMSSMDHAEENQQHLSLDSNSNEKQDARQFKYLITSGEEFQKQQQELQFKNSAENQQQLNETNPNQTNSNQNQQQQSTTGLTPTNSSYILPPSQSIGSSSYGNQTTPSPDNHSSFRSPSSGNQQQQQYYAQQQAQRAAAYPLTNDQFPINNQGYPNHLMKQRDVHSLADEQLYMANKRNYNASLLDKTEYTNYDFTISSSPRLSRRLMRRTASLSRNTPIRSTSANTNSQIALIGTVSSSRANSRNRLQDFQQATSNTLTNIQQQPSMNQIPKISHDDIIDHQFKQQANHISINQPHDAADSSHLAITSLIRKPSLQVRYDPLDLGGLMSREEVAALSHAQREQKRLEAELAEKRAKRPLLHLYLCIKEFITRQKLILSVLLIDVCLFKMFADLIV